MFTSVVPDTTCQQIVKFISRDGIFSDFQLMVIALDKLSNDVVFSDIRAMQPEYSEAGLKLTVTYEA